MSELLLPNRQQLPDLASHIAVLEQEMESLARLMRKQAVVLVVDGQKSQRTLLLQAVRMAGFEQILRAHEGGEAFDLLYKNQVDMVISDWDVPGWGGVQLLDWVRSQPAFSHLVFVMAANSEQERLVMQAAEERHDLFITKPFATNILSMRLPGVFWRRQVVAHGRWQELKGNFRSARESYLLAINNHPGRLWPYFSLGSLLGRNQRFEPASQCFLHVRKIDAKAHAALLDLALLKEMEGKMEEAQAMYSQLVKDHPWFLKPYDALAGSFITKGQGRRASALLERAVHWGGSQHAPRLFRLAQLYHEQGNEEKAIPLLQKAIQLRPWQAAGDKHHLLAEIYIKQGDMDLAGSHARQGLEYSLETSQTIPALKCLELWGIAQIKQGQAETALQTWSLAFDPGIWPGGELPAAPRKLAGNFAKLAREQKLNSVAHHYYNLAQSLAGKGDDNWLQEREAKLARLAAQGVELVQNGYFDEAEACYKQGLSLSPDSARLCFNLAKLHYRQGKTDSCTRYLEAARRLGPQDEELQREIDRFYE